MLKLVWAFDFGLYASTRYWVFEIFMFFLKKYSLYSNSKLNKKKKSKIFLRTFKQNTRCMYILHTYWSVFSVYTRTHTHINGAYTSLIFFCFWNGQSMVRCNIYKLYMVRYRFGLYHTTPSRHIYKSVTLTHSNIFKTKKPNRKSWKKQSEREKELKCVRKRTNYE